MVKEVGALVLSFSSRAPSSPTSHPGELALTVFKPAVPQMKLQSQFKMGCTGVATPPPMVPGGQYWGSQRLQLKVQSYQIQWWGE